MSGGGVGGLAGSALGLALAPETGGLSMMIPAIAGAGGAFLGSELTGGKNPLMDALLGGVGGGLGGAMSGGFDAAGLFGDGAAGAAGAGAADTLAAGAADAGASSLGDIGAAGLADTATSAGAGSGLSGIGSNIADTLTNGVAPTAETAATPASSSGLGAWLGNSSNLKNAAIAGGIALPALQSMMNPLPKYNVQGTANSVMATNPGFNSALPQYKMQNTATPYAGNWYTYGQQPEQAMYNARPVLQSHGGMAGYAHGGRVQHMAMGGAPMPMPQGMPPQGGQGAPQQKLPVNPLTLQAAHKVGMAIGHHLKNKIKTPPGKVSGAGGGQDDVIPAKLSDGEYIIPADTVAHLGDGSSNAGGKKLDHMVHQVRAHKAVKGFPPKAHNPLSYIKGKT